MCDHVILFHIAIYLFIHHSSMSSPSESAFVTHRNVFVSMMDKRKLINGVFFVLLFFFLFFFYMCHCHLFNKKSNLATIWHTCATPGTDQRHGNVFHKACLYIKHLINTGFPLSYGEHTKNTLGCTVKHVLKTQHGGREGRDASVCQLKKFLEIQKMFYKQL